MRRIFSIIFILLIFCSSAYCWGRKEKSVLFLSDTPENLMQVQAKNVFRINSRIYFAVSNPKGFKSDYIKYQIVKQDEKAHIAGLSRVRNVTCRLKNKNSYADYFVLSEAGIYFLQIFDITNLQQWVAIERFQVVSD